MNTGDANEQDHIDFDDHMHRLQPSTAGSVMEAPEHRGMRPMTRVQVTLARLPGTLKHWFTRALRFMGYQLVNIRKMYEFDGLHTVHIARFREEQRFQSAYARALRTSNGVDPQIAWRIHIGLWAASVASSAPGTL